MREKEGSRIFQEGVLFIDCADQRLMPRGGTECGSFEVTADMQAVIRLITLLIVLLT
jgi:hypothetical protein